jgi:hypothetical protein
LLNDIEPSAFNLNREYSGWSLNNQVTLQEIAKRNNSTLLNGEYYPVVFPSCKISIATWTKLVSNNKYANWFMHFFKKDEYILSFREEKTFFQKFLNFINVQNDEEEESETDYGTINIQTVPTLKKYLQFYNLSAKYDFSYIDLTEAQTQKQQAILTETVMKINYELFLKQYYEKKY